MAMIAPAIPYITAAMSAVSVVSGVQQASSQRKAQAAQLAHQQEQAALQQRLKERALERQSKSQKAAARARLGASGIGSTGGSGAAVIRGLEDDLNQRISDDRTLFNSSMAAPNLLDTGSNLGELLGAGTKLIGIGQDVGALLSKTQSNPGTVVTPTDNRA